MLEQDGGQTRLSCPPPGPAAFRPPTRLDRILVYGTRNGGGPRPGDREIKSGEAGKSSRTGGSGREPLFGAVGFTLDGASSVSSLAVQIAAAFCRHSR